MADTGIGVVVIGRNEGRRLVACLDSLTPWRLPVVYVDSGSTDDSCAAAQRAGAEIVELDLAKPFTAARARNEGAAALLSGRPELRYIQFVDGDCTVATGWLDTARAFLDVSPSHAVACGRRRERYPGATLYNRLADIEWATPIGDTTACGGDSLVRADAFGSVGGFDPALIAGEEPEMCSRLGERGWRIRRLDAEMTVHDAAMSRFSQWWRRAERSGFGYAQAWRTTRNRAEPLYRRQLASAIGWAVAPWGIALVMAFTVKSEALLVAPLLYLLQTARLAAGFGVGTLLSWQHAALLTLGKIPEALGAVRFSLRVMIGGPGSTIFYK